MDDANLERNLRRSLLAFLLGVALLLPLAAPLVTGCKAVQVEVCYVHPTWGKVCVGIDGKVFLRADLTDDARREVLEWLKQRRGANP